MVQWLLLFSVGAACCATPPAPSELSAVQGPTPNATPISKPAGKWIDEAYQARIEAAYPFVLPIVKRAEDQMKRGLYEEALASLAEAKAAWGSRGIKDNGYPQYETECLFQLGRYKDVVERFPWKYGTDSKGIAALGISLVRLGRIEEALALTPNRLILESLSEQNRPYLPGTDTPEKLEATFWLIRGIDLVQSANPDSIRDLEIADTLVPHQPLIRYYLSSGYLANKDYERCREAAKDAVVLPGAWGDVARRNANRYPTPEDYANPDEGNR